MPITGSTQLAGLLGYPARYSLSPTLHNAAYQAIGFDAAYVVMPTKAEHLGDAVRSVRALSMLGVSITVPYKEAVIAHLDRLDPAAANLRSVNCIHNNDGELVGYSTDGDGFVASLLAAGHEVKAKRVHVRGAGGAARAVIEAVARHGAAQVVVHARQMQQGQDACQLAGQRGEVASSIDQAADADILINATPLGMNSHPGVAFPEHCISERQLVADLVYEPRQTKMLALAHSRGAQAVNGLGMLLHQAGAQIEIWTGQPAPIDAMQAALDQA